MRLGEIFTLISLTLSTVVVFIPQRNRPFLFSLFSFSLPIIILFHIIFELPRWQMIPAYVFAGIIILIIIVQSRKRKKAVKIFFPQKKKHPPFLLMLIVCIILIFIILLPVLLPVFTLPPPTGSYAVGTAEYTIHDRSRPESITDNPGDYRKLVVKIWYPADPPGNEKKDMYWDNPVLFSAYLAKEYQFPPFFLEHLGLVNTNSLIHPPVSAQQDYYPIVLSLHGGTCINSVRDLQIINEELASHGYIVIGLTNPYSSLPVVFADGQTAACSDIRRKNLNMQSLLTQTLWDSYITQQPSENNEILQNIFDMEAMTTADIKIRTGDIQSVIAWLDEVKEGKITTRINGKYDSTRISVCGLHLGGSVALNSFLREPHIKACVNIDGFHYTGTGEVKISKPYLLITSEESRMHTLPFIKNQLGARSYLITLKGTTKQSFTDRSLFSPLIDLLHLNGKLNNKNTVIITRQYITAFLSTYSQTDSALDTKEFKLIENLNHKYKELMIAGENKE